MENHDAQANYADAQQDEMASPSVETLQQVNATMQSGSTTQGDVVKMLQSLLTEMQELRQDFDTKVKYDESKERQLDSMHKELQVYRDGLHFKILRPLFIDLIAVHDDLGKLIEGLLSRETEQILGRMIDNLKSFQNTIEDILFRNGVDLYSLDGDTYVPNKQRALQVIDTTDPEEDKRIARRIRKGFEYEGRILRAELVAIYRTV